MLRWVLSVFAALCRPTRPPVEPPALSPQVFTDTVTLPRQRGNDPERERMLEELRELKRRVRRLEAMRK